VPDGATGQDRIYEIFHNLPGIVYNNSSDVPLRQGSTKFGVIHIQMKHGWHDPATTNCIRMALHNWDTVGPGNSPDSRVFRARFSAPPYEWGGATDYTVEVVIGRNVHSDGRIAGIISAYVYKGGSWANENDDVTGSDWQTCAAAKDWY
jgi:hypothetical protein